MKEMFEESEEERKCRMEKLARRKVKLVESDLRMDEDLRKFGW